MHPSDHPPPSTGNPTRALPVNVCVLARHPAANVLRNRRVMTTGRVDDDDGMSDGCVLVVVWRLEPPPCLFAVVVWYGACRPLRLCGNKDVDEDDAVGIFRSCVATSSNSAAPPAPRGSGGMHAVRFASKHRTPGG